MQRGHSDQQFWLYQAVGWSLFALLQLLLVAADEPLRLHNALPALLLLLVAFSGSVVLRQFWRRLQTATSGSAAMLGYWLCSALGLAVVSDQLHYWLLWPVSRLDVSLHGVFDAQPMGASAVLLWPLFLVWSALYLMLSRQRQWQAAQRLHRDSELRLQQSQLQSLLAQLNPHFMFNCINNIRALILEDPAAARNMLAHFADMLRYQVAASPEVLVPLRSELAVAEDYIALMKIQFEQRLEFRLQVDPQCSALLLPKLTVQLLLENAIKHGISRSRAGGQIQLQAKLLQAPDRWQLSVCNTGQLPTVEEAKADATAALTVTSPFDGELNTNGALNSNARLNSSGGMNANGMGSGLANLQQRLQLLFGPAAQFSLQQEAEMVCARLTFSAGPLLAATELSSTDISATSELSATAAQTTTAPTTKAPTTTEQGPHA